MDGTSVPPSPAQIPTSQPVIPQPPAPQMGQTPVAQSITPPPLPIPPIIEQPMQAPPSDVPKSSSKTFMLALISIVFLLLVGGAGFYILNAGTEKPEDTYTSPPAPVYKNPTPTSSAADINQQSANDIDAQTMQIEKDLNQLSSVSANIDSGLNDKATNLTP